MCLASGCGEDLTQEETGIIRITITPRPVYTTTPIPTEEGDDSVGSNVTMNNEYTNQESGGEGSPTPTPEMQYDIYGNPYYVGDDGNNYYYDINGNAYTFDVYGNIVYADGSSSSAASNAGNNNGYVDYNNYDYNAYNTYDTYGNYGYDANYGYYGY